ncbi:MAG: hypothetical protein WHU54_09570 [Candidatus Bathyarchaeia archaeon]
MSKTKLKTFKMHDDEISELKRLAKKHGVSETDIIKLGLEIVRKWNDGECEFALTILLPQIMVTFEDGTKAKLFPHYVMEEGKIACGGLFDDANVPLKYDRFTVSDRIIIKDLIADYNRLCPSNKIVSFKVLN